jgi:hypothetical protein
LLVFTSLCFVRRRRLEWETVQHWQAGQAGSGAYLWRLGGQAGGIQEFLGFVGFSQHHFNTPDLAVLLFWVGDGGGGKWQVRSWDHEEDE